VNGTDVTTVLVILVAIYFALAYFGSKRRNQVNQQRTQAYHAYQNALGHLKIDPMNPDLKQKALELGRIYSNWTRNAQGVTLFDEVALMNDISAATAGAASYKSMPPVSVSVETRLAKLAELRASGIIDEQEYSAKRQKIIDEM
jgi:hypothetical protein